jgi:hypothetical protein
MRHYFRHFRLFDERGNLLPHGGVTIYVRHFSAVGDSYWDEEPTDVEVTTAVCSHKDSYNKRLGRRIAFGRRHSADAHVLSLDTADQDITNELHDIATRAICSVHFKGEYNRLGLVHKHDD